MSLYDRMMDIDRRIIYTALIIIVCYVVLNPIGLPIKVSPETQNYYETMEAVPEDGVILVDMAYSPGSVEELNPMVYAILRHAFKNNYDVIMTGMWQQGPQIGQGIWDDVKDEYDVTYGEDFVNVGYAPGNRPPVLNAMMESFAKAYPKDFKGNKTEDIPLIQKAPALTEEYIDFITVLETGSPGTSYYLTYVTQKGQDIPLTTGIITMSVPDAKPFLETGQYAGIIPGNKGAAEYEQLIGETGEATVAQDAISIAAVFCTFLIIIGNLGYVFLQGEE